MHPHSYAVDSLTKSQDLATSILTSSAPSQISQTCASIDHFLHSHSPDQSRHFFSLTFPTLICKLYGFDDAVPPSGPHHRTSPTGWIDIVQRSNDAALASSVFNLLSPNGILFQSISAVDRHSLVKYVFPIERLPDWARLMLSNEKDCQVLNGLFTFLKGKIKEELIKGSSCCQVQLNVFEYFVFWFAYYPISKGNSENASMVSSSNVSVKRGSKFKLENWAASFSGLSSTRVGNEMKLECNLYVRLLHAYLRTFVPTFDLNSHQPYRSSLLHYAGGNDGSVLMRAEFLVDTLVNYWLVDNDFSPLPVNVCKSFGLSFPLRSVLRETPPTPGLGEVVKWLVKYLNLSAVAGKEGGENVESPRWGRFDVKTMAVDCPALVVGSWNSWIQRPVYRFVLRTFLFCPVGTSMNNASQVFSVWLDYMEPWKLGLNDFAELDAIVDGKDVKQEGAQGKDPRFSPSWQSYVLSNYLYYSSLVMHFIGFAHKFLHTDPEGIVQMVLKVIEILTSSKELTDLVKNIDIVFHSKQAGSGKSKLNTLWKYAPLIREQLQDWEDGLCENDADGSFLHENWNKDLKLFSDGEDGGQQLLQLFILRADSEFQATSSDNLAQHLQLIDSLKKHVNCLFGGFTLKPLSFTPEKKEHELCRDEVFKPRRIGSQAMGGIKYRGDWMKRPISDDEVAWLAKLLIGLSSWLNESLGLNQSEGSNAADKWSYIDVSSGRCNVCGPTETTKVLLSAILSWFLMASATAVRLMREHGLRINLRVLASKKIVTFLLVSALFCILRRAFRLVL